MVTEGGKHSSIIIFKDFYLLSVSTLYVSLQEEEDDTSSSSPTFFNVTIYAHLTERYVQVPATLWSSGSGG